MYVCASVCVSVCLYVCMDGWMYVCKHACMHACMYVCVCMCMCMYIYMYIYIFVHISTIVQLTSNNDLLLLIPAKSLLFLFVNQPLLRRFHGFLGFLRSLLKASASLLFVQPQEAYQYFTSSDPQPVTLFCH